MLQESVSYDDPAQLDLFVDGFSIDIDKVLKRPPIVPGRKPGKYEIRCDRCAIWSTFEWTPAKAVEMLRDHIREHHIFTAWGLAERNLPGSLPMPGPPPEAEKMDMFAQRLVYRRLNYIVDPELPDVLAAARDAGLSEDQTFRAVYYEGEGRLDELFYRRTI